MKNTLILLTISILFFNCVNKTPNLSEEDYKKEQLEYEALKKKLSADKSVFFKKNKDSLMKKISLFKKLKDSSTVFSDVNIDSLFYLKNVQLHSDNYRAGRLKQGDKAIFLSKNDKKIFERTSLPENYEQLYSCLENNQSCKYMETAILKDFLAIKYAFIVDGYTIMEPSIQDKSNFKSGLFFSTVLVYDLVKNKPLYKYSFSATNSKEISYRDSNRSYLKEKPRDVIKRDFNNNILLSFRKESKKHFNFNW